MNTKTLISVFLVLFVSFVYSQKAELLFHKKIVEGPVVGKHLPVQFIIYNVGSDPAYDVSFIDNDFITDDFDIISGQTEGKWETIAPGATIQTNLTVEPKKSGIYSLTSTVLNYRKSQHDSEFTVSSAASYSGMYVESQADYEKRTSLLVKEIIFFIVLCVAAVGLPYSIVNHYKKTYESGIKKN